MEKNQIAIYGLGVMGASLARNLLDRGYRVSLYSKGAAELERFSAGGWGGTLCPTVEELLDSLAPPRVILLMITAGDPVDQVIGELLPRLDRGDVLLDCGNSFYKDTDRRAAYLQQQGIHYLGVGVSGGEAGALAGPSMMAGGSREGWDLCGHMLQDMAAKAEDGDSCCAFLGAGGAGHYVKTVHNGIEYAILQLIADVYHIMKHGMGLEHHAILEAFHGWKTGPLASYLIDITEAVLSVMDGDGTPLVEKILDVAGQKGTGNWTLVDAINRGVYVPTIGESVTMRAFSGKQAMRELGSRTLSASVHPFPSGITVPVLEQALLAGVIFAFAQGLELMETASEQNGWGLDLPLSISLWREGCIIRCQLLPRLIDAVKEGAPNILLSRSLADVAELEPALRQTASGAIGAGLAVPTLVSALSWYDCCRAGQLPLNLVQALRDCFGAHTYQRTDRPGQFHTQWEAEAQA